MVDKLILQYIDRMNLNDIENFAFQYGIILEKNETKLIYDYIKQDWRTLLYGNPRPILDELKCKLKPLTYNKLETLFIHFKEKYKNYL